MKRGKNFTFIICLLFGCMVENTNGQTEIIGRFTNYTLNTSNYIVFNPDNSFLYSRAVHVQRAFLVGNTALITIQSNYFIRPTCWTRVAMWKKINLVKNKYTNSYSLLGSLDDTLARPK